MRRKDSPKSGPTIRDIARLAEVSASTVSRVLNQDPRVGLANRGAVNAAMEHARYRPCSAAQWLARGKSRTFGVLTQDITSEHFGQILSGIVLALRGTGYCPVFTAGWPGDEAGEHLEMLLRNRVDALIVVGRLDEERMRQVAAEIPLLNIGPTIPGLEARCVTVENRTGAYEATRHLLELGHRQIAHIVGLADHRHSLDRLEGFRAALADARCKHDPRLLIEGNFKIESGAAAVEQLLLRGVPFTAIFASNDCMAYGALNALCRHGIRVPRDVSVIGFDDRPYSAHTTPALTTMRQPSIELGTAAVQALLRELRGEPVSPPRFSTPLVLRESTAKARPAPLRRAARLLGSDGNAKRANPLFTSASGRPGRQTRGNGARRLADSPRGS